MFLYIMNVGEGLLIPARSQMKSNSCKKLRSSLDRCFNCLHPLEVLGNIVKIGEEPVYVNPKVDNDDDVGKYFS